ncbi:MAG: hypothetical protein JO127_17095 [Caulobacteraceae bacterium]|nr:hypothetical protein [Caulobacteraceae bacterium]
MPLSTRAPCAALFAAAGLAAASPTLAHGVVGKRFFPATIATDDPAVADELSLPTIAVFKSADAPPAVETDVSGEWSKRITSHLGVSFADGWTRIHAPDGTASGFSNFETTLKYLVVANAPHELMISTGLSAEWGGTGAARVGAERTTTLTPTLYFGKGAGDLPEALAWARPFALTGVLGLAVPAAGGETRSFEAGFALEYSLRYLASHVRDLGLPRTINQMTPLVEVQFSSPIANRAGAPTTGTVNPGLLWSGQHLQLGAEAMIPINAASGRGVGTVFQVHWFIDDLLPRSVGRPVW